MAWIDEARKHTAEPVAVVEIAFTVPKKYSVDYIRPAGTTAYKGNILKLPYISNSIGDLVRTFISSKIEIIFADTDREFRNLIMTEGIKNREVTVKLLFVNTTVAAGLTIFIGNIYNWNPMKDMKFMIECEQKSKNLKNIYPNKVVTVTDYANVDEFGLGKLIPVPYGTISALTLSVDGAFPCILVDPTEDAEEHLASLQAYIEEVTNGDFSEGDPPDDWTARAGATLSQEAGGVDAGDCLMITGDGNANPWALGRVDLVAGRTYKFSYYVKEGDEATFAAYVWHNGEGYGILGPGEEATGAWVEHTVTFKATATETSDIHLVQICDADAGTFIYFDEVHVYEVIGIDKVYIDKEEKTIDTHYTISYQIIDNKVHAEIHWETGVKPRFDNLVSCDISFGTRAPCEAWKHFLINFCGYVDGDFDATSYDAAYAIEYGRGYTLDGAFITGKELIAHEDQIRNEFELDIWRDPKDGLIHFKYISALLPITVHYKDYVDILKGYEPNTRVEKIINYLKYLYNYNYARHNFHNRPYREDADSQTKYGATYRDQQNFYFVRSASVALDLASRKLLRRKDPIVFDKFPLPIKAFNDSLGDVIEITHFEGKGSAGYVKRAFQIRTTQDDPSNFTRKETLEDVTNYIGSAFILGPGDMARYTLATAEQREKYGFLCGDTAPNVDKYSDGDPAKRLYD